MLARTRDGGAGGIALTLALLAMSTGCGEDPTTTGRAEQRPSESLSSPAQSPSSPDAEPSDTEPSDAEPSDDETPAETPAEPPAAGDPTRKGTARLLSAGQLPGFNETFRWRVASTSRQEGSKPFGTCHRFAMTSIGASEVTVRRYAPARPAEGATASHLLADFADTRTAKRAHEVLKSWSAQCEDRLRRFGRVEVGGLRTVEAAASSPSGASAGDWYLLIYGPAPDDRDAGYFDAQGFSRVGDTISVLQMRVIGQDYNYPPGEEPMVAAVQAAAAKLGGR